MDGQNQSSPEPMDISQAFQMLRNRDQAAADVPEPDGAAAEPEPAGEQLPEPEPYRAEPEGQGDDGEVAPVVDDGGDVGGSPAGNEEIDYGASRNNLIQSLQQQAVRNVTKDFQDHGVKMMSMQDIYRRDEDGTVHFDNPDNPRMECQSRAEAQAWIESMNKEISRTFNEEVRKKTQELYQQAQPAVMLLEFAPTYDAMDETVKAVFNDLVEPYSVYNQAGDIIGFNCNLNRMAAQAQKMASRFAPQQQAQPKAGQQQPKAAVPDEPAMDIKTGGGSAAPEDEEPKTVEEAMALLQKRKRDGNGQ